jgi:baculoviral IAP repeat-containing protein 6
VAADDAWEAAYVQALKPLRFEAADIPTFYAPYAQLAARDGSGGGGARAKAKRLAREAAQLSSEDGLPLGPGAAIAVRCDGGRQDCLRALICGPPGTPYALGCFIFDLFCPADYPAIPPLVHFDTTNGGRVRFNPNLYADGKVCLSLLGTHGSVNASESWSPSSTLAQVLISIQAMILVDQPYYNDGAAETVKGTAEGGRKAAEYVQEVRLATLRYAVLAQLRAPRQGLEDTIRAHFRACAPALRAQCAAWVAESGGDALQRARLAEAASEVLVELGRIAPDVPY